jgi:PHD/YefM family antitoxin component YafN of YafNO toxin-antitoxin module
MLYRRHHDVNLGASANTLASTLNFMLVSDMAIDLESIHSLSDFQRNAKQHIRRLKRSGKPAVLTVKGQAEVVVQSAEAYQKLLNDQAILESLRGVSRALEQAKRGEGRQMREFLEELAKEHGFALK